MSNTLSGARLSDEAAFFKRYLSGLGSHTQTYDDDYVCPPEKRPRRMPVLSLEVAAPPYEDEEHESKDPSTSSESISLTIKSLKPSLTFSIEAHPTDSVSDLKAIIASTTLPGSSATNGPPVTSQRLLLKGKALTDSKLLKEYDELKAGSVITLVVKAGWVPSASATATPNESTTPTIVSTGAEGATSPGGSSVPIINISETDPYSPSSEHPHNLPARPMEASDMTNPSSGVGPTTNTTAEFHDALSDPTFWSKIHGVCQDQFRGQGDADGAVLAFLYSVRDKLSAGELAKIQDSIGVTSMGGTSI